MIDQVHADTVGSTQNRQCRRHQRGKIGLRHPLSSDSLLPTIDVGRKLHDLRIEHGLSIRLLAELSGLNVNTLSLIENGKSSPSVSTLQLLAGALAVPISAFFEAKVSKNSITYQKAGQRLQAGFANGTLADLGGGLTLRGGQPLLLTLNQNANSGPAPIVHTGYEFVFCLKGHLSYVIEDQKYILDPGDSLMFEAHLPHRWQNVGETTSQSLLIMCPVDESDHPTERHFKPVQTAGNQQEKMYENSCNH
jgi:transcriptional regulator with XRE-family HTH domain